MPVAGEVAAGKVRIAHGRVDVRGELVARADVEVVADEVAASPGRITIEARIFYCAVVAIKEIVKAVGAACEPVPAIAAVYTQILCRLKFQLDFRGFDILEYDVIVRRPAEETKEAFETVINVVIRIAIAVA